MDRLTDLIPAKHLDQCLAYGTYLLRISYNVLFVCDRVSPAVLKLIVSSDPPTSASQAVGTTQHMSSH